MKKTIALFTVLALFSASVFALPTPAPVGIASPAGFTTEVYGLKADNPVPAQSLAPSAFEADLFAGVQGVPLTDAEAQAVEGEGVAGAIAGGHLGGAAGYVVGGIIGGIAGAITGNSDGAKTGAAVGAGIGSAIGTIVGAICGP